MGGDSREVVPQNLPDIYTALQKNSTFARGSAAAKVLFLFMKVIALNRHKMLCHQSSSPEEIGIVFSASSAESSCSGFASSAGSSSGMCTVVGFVVLGIDRANTICTAAACCFGSVFGIFFVFRFVTAGALVLIRAAALRQVVTIACGFQSLVVCLFQCVNSCSGSCGSCCNHCSDNRSFHIDTSFLRHHVLCRRVRKCTRCGSSAGRRQKTQTFPDYSFRFAVIFLHL